MSELNSIETWYIIAVCVQAFFTIVIAITTYSYTRWTKIMAKSMSLPDIRATRALTLSALLKKTFPERRIPPSKDDHLWGIEFKNYGDKKAIVSIERRIESTFVFKKYYKLLTRNDHEIVLDADEVRFVALASNIDFENEVFFIKARNVDNITVITKWEFTIFSGTSESFNCIQFA